MLELFIVIFLLCFFGFFGYLGYQYWLRKYKSGTSDAVNDDTAVSRRVPPNVQALKHFSAAQWRVSNGSRISLGSANTDINDMSLSISIFQPPPPPPRYSTIDIPQLGPKSS
ncbi:uncharacterized protein LOC110848520 [Folsomia candida]|uniref:Uncharacterized protein n=1 Tax=Folsomia candida TaxID=158441 RepID=A0A226EGI4_FOLCA|nr:uncharacterized protein LOC110848520 [Folsomia candida]OXA55766.1 hypothetical protein Fcan01_10016 [Folsomia candida]